MDSSRSRFRFASSSFQTAPSIIPSAAIFPKRLASVFLPVPLVSKVCPSDVYRVWKSGSCLRVDTTLLGFEHMTWLKGRRSYIFKGEGAADTDW